MSNVLVITDQPIVNKPNVYTNSSNFAFIFAGDIHDNKLQAAVYKTKEYDMVLYASTLIGSPAEKKCMEYIESLKEYAPDIAVVVYDNKY